MTQPYGTFQATVQHHFFTTRKSENPVLIIANIIMMMMMMMMMMEINPGTWIDKPDKRLRLKDHQDPMSVGG